MQWIVAINILTLSDIPLTLATCLRA